MVVVIIISNQWVQGSLSILLTYFPGIFSKARQSAITGHVVKIQYLNWATWLNCPLPIYMTDHHW